MAWHVLELQETASPAAAASNDRISFFIIFVVIQPALVSTPEWSRSASASSITGDFARHQ